MRSRNIAERITVFGNAAVSQKKSEIWLEAAFDGNGAVIIFFE